MISVFHERRCDDPMRIARFIPYENLKRAIVEEGKMVGLPITVELDEMKVGKGLASIGAKSQPCVAVYHSQYRKKYYSHVITQAQQGNAVFISMYLGGNSSNYETIVMTSQRNNSFLGSIMNNRAQAAMDDERMFYRVVKEVIFSAVKRALVCPEPCPVSQTAQSYQYTKQPQKTSPSSAYSRESNSVPRSASAETRPEAMHQQPQSDALKELRKEKFADPYGLLKERPSEPYRYVKPKP